MAQDCLVPGLAAFFRGRVQDIPAEVRIKLKVPPAPPEKRKEPERGDLWKKILLGPLVCLYSPRDEEEEEEKSYCDLRVMEKTILACDQMCEQLKKRTDQKHKKSTKKKATPSKSKRSRSHRKSKPNTSTEKPKKRKVKEEDKDKGESKREVIEDEIVDRHSVDDALAKITDNVVPTDFADTANTDNFGGGPIYAALLRGRPPVGPLPSSETPISDNIWDINDFMRKLVEPTGKSMKLYLHPDKKNIQFVPPNFTERVAFFMPHTFHVLSIENRATLALNS